MLFREITAQKSKKPTKHTPTLFEANAIIAPSVNVTLSDMALYGYHNKRW
jgi:hypothetical protein